MKYLFRVKKSKNCDNFCTTGFIKFDELDEPVDLTTDQDVTQCDCKYIDICDADLKPGYLKTQVN